MTKRRGRLLVVVWTVTTLAVTLWVAARGDEVTPGNAMLVGVVVGTMLTAVLAKARKG